MCIDGSSEGDRERSHPLMVVDERKTVLLGRRAGERRKAIPSFYLSGRCCSRCGRLLPPGRMLCARCGRSGGMRFDPWSVRRKKKKIYLPPLSSLS